MHDDSRAPTSVSRRATWMVGAVHLYTAAGAVLALLALRAFLAGAPREGFLWLYAAIACSPVSRRSTFFGDRRCTTG